MFETEERDTQSEVVEASSKTNKSSSLLTIKEASSQLLKLIDSNAHKVNKEVTKPLKNREKYAVLVLENSKILTDPKLLAKISPYFRAAFFGGFMETYTKTLNIDRLNAKHFIKCYKLLQKIINNNNVSTLLDNISLQSAFEIFDIASYLLIDPLLEILSDLIMSKVNANTLILAYHKSEYRYIPLANRLWRIIVSEFKRLYANKTFLQLTEAEILRLLKDKRLNIESNVETTMVKSWIAVNDKHGDTATALRSQLIGRCDVAGFYEGGTRLPTSVLIASGGWSHLGPTAMVEAYDSRAGRWVQPIHKLFEVPRAYHGVVNTGKELISLGGFNGAEYYKTTRKFTFETKTLVEIAPMHDQRCYVGCALLDSDHIIAVGGYNNVERLDTAEILHISRNQWNRISRMSVCRSDGHCVVLNGVPYAIGGFDGTSCHDTVEYYDSHHDHWYTMGNPMITKRSGVCAIAAHGIIFVCGGFDGINRLQTCEITDPREGKWHSVKPMLRMRSNFGIEFMANRVVVAGGYGGAVGTLSDVESFDFRQNMWSEMPELSLRRSALYLTRVDDSEIIEELVR